MEAPDLLGRSSQGGGAPRWRGAAGDEERRGGGGAPRWRGTTGVEGPMRGRERRGEGAPVEGGRRGGGAPAGTRSDGVEGGRRGGGAPAGTRSATVEGGCRGGGAPEEESRHGLESVGGKRN